MMGHSCYINGETMVPFKPVSLRLSCFSVFCFSHLVCMLSRHRYKDILPNTPCVRCRRLESTIRAVMLSVVHFPHLGFTSASVAQLPPRLRKLLDETVKTFALFFPRVNNFSIVTTNAFCWFRYARAAFTTADGKVAARILFLLSRFDHTQDVFWCWA